MTLLLSISVKGGISVCPYSSSSSSSSSGGGGGGGGGSPYLSLKLGLDYMTVAAMCNLPLLI